MPAVLALVSISNKFQNLVLLQIRSMHYIYSKNHSQTEANNICIGETVTIINLLN